jgi:hypothetical protein
MTAKGGAKQHVILPVYALPWRSTQRLSPPPQQHRMYMLQRVGDQGPRVPMAITFASLLDE